MTLLPSPIPHPLDYSPWDLPGWIYEALDWVVGVEWPDGNEKNVWDLADQWYAVASALAGPRADAVAAATEVRGGYGGVGAVAEAFDAAWRRVAEGDDAPLPVLLAVSHDLGRLVEECGCDIEGAKIEVWIELGILVVELLCLAVAAVLTAGAASPAAAGAIAATRLLVQQIFKRLTAQLARKSLKAGLKEAGERAASQVAEGGVRGLARRSAIGGMWEAGQEGGVNLATQAYQNSTGRRHGVDLADLGTSALGGVAGGAAAPLAGLGRHATGRGAQIGEHLVREMAGEMIADQAASLATGQGLTSVEDAARAAASGARGSATGQIDAALQARLDAQLGVAGGAGSTTMDLDAEARSALTQSLTPQSPVAPQEQPLHHAAGVFAQSSPPAVETGQTASSVVERLPSPEVNATTPAPVRANLDGAPITADAVEPRVPLSTVNAGVPPWEASRADLVTRPGIDEPRATAPTSPSEPSGPALTAAAPTTTVAHGLTGADSSHTGSVGQGSLGVAPAAGPSAVSTHPAGQPLPGSLAGPTVPTPSTGSGPMHQATRGPQTGSPGASAGNHEGRGDPPAARARLPLLESLGPATQANPDLVPPMTEGRDVGRHQPRTPEWYAARLAADREGIERRRYRDHLDFQRSNYEDNRRRDSAARLRAAADRSYDEARWLISESRRLDVLTRRVASEHHYRAGQERERLSHEQRDLAEAVLAGAVAPAVVRVDEWEDFHQINDDIGDLAPGGVSADDRSALTGDDHPPPIDRSRRYGQPGGLRPPLALHQADVERQMPRDGDGSVTRTADPRHGSWFGLLNDGGPNADPTKGINCIDCTLSLFDTWVHGRPRVSAPRTFDAYLQGDVNRPIDGELDGMGRIEDVTGGRFQRLCDGRSSAPGSRQIALDTGYRNLHDQLLLGGHGSFAFVANQWESGGAHIWVALNQQGTVLYLDPQTGAVAPQPLYRHHGRPYHWNAVDADVLILDPQGRPMPLAGLQRGRYSSRAELPAHPSEDVDRGYGEPYINRMHLLGAPSAAPASDGERSRTSGLVAETRDELRSSRIRAQEARRAGALPVRPVLRASQGVDEVFAAGVTAAEIVAEIDVPSLRRLVPTLDEQAADDVVELFADPRVRAMFDRTWREPPKGEPMLAETLVRQLVESPDLVRVILTTPELAASLTARPLTLHHLANHGEAIDLLATALSDIGRPGIVAGERTPRPALLTERQREISSRVAARGNMPSQPGFDITRRNDAAYRDGYVRELYVKAAEAQSELNQMVARSAGASGRPGWRKAPKGERRVRDKLVEYDHDASRIKDLAAAKIEFDDLGDLYEALDQISRDPAVVVVGAKDRFVNPQGSGYRDILVNLRMSNGHIAELRLHLMAVDLVASWEHPLYEVRRDIEALAEAADRPLTARERAVVDGLLRRSQEAYWRAMGGEGSGVAR